MKITDSQRIDRLYRKIATLTERVNNLDEWSNGADEMLTELNHALPDPEYDAKCEENAVAIQESLERHAVRLGLAKPKIKQLDQSVAKNNYVCIESTHDLIAVGTFGSVTGFDDQFHTNFVVNGNDMEYSADVNGDSITLDAGDAWQAKFKRVYEPVEKNPLIERENLAAELLEIDLGLPSVCETCGAEKESDRG